MRLARWMTVAVLGVCLAGGAAYGVTFSIDQGPAGSVPPHNDGTLFVYTTQLGGSPDVVSQLLVGTPLDALHIGAPVSGLVAGDYGGPREWGDIEVIGTLLYSLDHGDPFPVGIDPDSQEEVRAAWPAPPPALPGDWVTKTALGYNMWLSLTDTRPATEPNMGLGPDAAFDDDVDALDTKNLTDQDPIFFSIDDRITLVPNLPADYRTGDIYCRFPDGGIVKVIDAVLDLGLAHDGDGSGPLFYRNDDIDAMILVNLDDCIANNHSIEVQYTPPGTTDPKSVLVDLGDAIIFSIDRATDLPYANGGISGTHHQPSIPTEYIWISTYGGLSGLQALVSHMDLGLSVGTQTQDDIDALAYGVYSCSAIPEPGTLLLLGTAALALVGVVRRRRMK